MPRAAPPERPAPRRASRRPPPGRPARPDLPAGFFFAALGLPLSASLLLTAPAYLNADCPWTQLPGAAPLGPIGWTVSLLAALLFALPSGSRTARPGSSHRALFAWSALAGVLLSSLGNLHTLAPYTCAYVALMLLYAHLGQTGLNAGLAGTYLLAATGKLNPHYALTVPAFFAQSWQHQPFGGALYSTVLLAVLCAPLLELLTAGLLAFRPRLAALTMITLHSGILIGLTRQHWGQAVWVWNLQLLLLGAAPLYGPFLQVLRGPTTAANGKTNDTSGRHRTRRPAPRPVLIGLACAAVISLPYTLGYNDLPIALPLYTGNLNSVTLTLPGGATQDASSEAVRRTGSSLSSSPTGLMDYAACRIRLGKAVSARLHLRWSLTSRTH